MAPETHFTISKSHIEIHLKKSQNEELTNEKPPQQLEENELGKEQNAY